MPRTIDYGNLMHRAMRGLIQEVLTDVRKRAAGRTPLLHHLRHHSSGRRIADWLCERYQSEMTVVIQHWYDDLEVATTASRSRSISEMRPRTSSSRIDAIQTFVDPSVEFGLRFETQDDDGDDDDRQRAHGHEDTAGTDEAPRGEAEVVSLDSFRK